MAKSRRGNKKSIFDSINADAEQIAVQHQDSELNMYTKPKFESDSGFYITSIEKEQYEKYKEENLKLYNEKQSYEERINEYIKEIDNLKKIIKEIEKVKKVKEKTISDDLKIKYNEIFDKAQNLENENKILKSELSRIRRKMNNIINEIKYKNVNYSQVKRTMMYETWN